MKPKLSSECTVLVVALLLSLLIRFSKMPAEAQQVAAATIKIINPLSGDGKFIFNTTQYPVNSTFTADVYIENVTGMIGWQIYTSWSGTVIHYQIAWIPDDSVFAKAIEDGATLIAPQPYVEERDDEVFMKYAAALLPPTPIDVPGMGLLCKINFTIAASPQDSEVDTNIVLIPKETGSVSLDTFVVLKDVPVPVLVEPAIVRIQREEMLIVQDLAVTSIEAEPSILEAGDVTTIKIALKNLGNDMETANASIKYNETLINQFSQPLGPSQTFEWDYDWNTTGVAPGTHRISVDVTPLPKETETKNNHAETILIVAEKLVGLNYIRWLFVTWLNTLFGIFTAIYLSAFIGFLALFWAYRKSKFTKI
jgi:hypothetical protein